MAKLRLILVGFLVAIILTGIGLARHTYKPIEGVITVELLAGCQMDYLDTTLQPVSTVLINCPGVDSIRIWPLPVYYPWMEEPITPTTPPGCPEYQKWYVTGYIYRAFNTYEPI